MSDLAAAVDESICPPYERHPHACQPSGALKGKVYNFSIKSTDSPQYPGIKPRKDWDKVYPAQPENKTTVLIPVGPKGKRFPAPFRNAQPDTPDITLPQPFTRKIRVYVPPGVDTSSPLPFLIMLDGVSIIEKMAETAANKLVQCCCCCGLAGDLMACISPIYTVDKLIDSGKLVKFVLIAVDNGGEAGGQSYGTQRCVEFDTCSPAFVNYVEETVLPRVQSECGIELTKDPNLRAVMGTSSGGAASFSFVYFRPDLYRRMLAYSGSWVNQQYPYNPEMPLGCWEFHGGKQLIANADEKNIAELRVLMYSMELDMGYDLPEESFHNWTLASNRMAKVLKEKGATCRHVFCKDAVHTDNRVFAHTLPDALIWLWDGVVAKE